MLVYFKLYSDITYFIKIILTGKIFHQLSSMISLVALYATYISLFITVAFWVLHAEPKGS